MAQQTVCDLCNTGEALEPKTGMYVVTIRKVIKVDVERSSETYKETEFDVCGECMAKVMLARPALGGGIPAK